MGVEHFDVFIIGTGTAGKSVAKDCAKQGLKVAIADNREYGGTCPNRGCDPKKVLVGFTEIIDRATKMQGKGIFKMPQVNWSDLAAFKKTFVNAIPATTEKDLASLDIRMYHQSPHFINETTLSVEGKTITAGKIVIATGQKPLELKIPGRELALLSEDFLDLEQLPETMLFIGSGYIGMEFAHIAARFGVKVTMIDAAPGPLSNFDQDMVNYILQVSQEDLGINFIFNAQVKEIEKLRKNYKVKATQHGKEISAKARMVFNTAGRVPSIEDLELSKGNVAFSAKGVTVNKFLQSTTNKNVYACGDVSASTGLPLTPLSSRESKIVSANLLNKNKPKKAEYPPQPTAVFTLPNLASVGLQEKQAREEGFDFTVEHKAVPGWFNAKHINEKIYAYKTLVDNKTGLVIGAHLVGPQASEIINLFVMAMCGNLDANTLKQIIFTYPSWAGDIKSMV